MRSPGAMAVVVRRPDGGLAIKKGPWRSIAQRFPLLKRPFLRGTVILIETLLNGLQALNFSAMQAAEDTEGADGKPGELSNWALAGTMAFSFLLGLGLFVVVPHLLSAFLLRVFSTGQGVESFWFHALDGAIKMTLFLGYVLAIGCLRDIRRVFQYHGAEHKSIYTYEAGRPLTVENAREYSTLHPRCGTAFLMVVLIVSIGLFAVVLPLFPLPDLGYFKTALLIFIKLGLMLPVAGISYEIIRWAGNKKSPLVSALIYPGLLMQRITTRPPEDDQLEVALEALRLALDMEDIQGATKATS